MKLELNELLFLVNVVLNLDFLRIEEGGVK